MNCGDEAGASSGHLDWRFSQVSGERSAGEEVQEGEEMLDHELHCPLQDCIGASTLITFI
ncbi:hypothetical protein DY000_02004693 [Brassica cretica]|uniref:Uncharacterized protein n=1 Tax=Brassica cretica TaxID=69181 RepID=A0ABQ7CK85_BRACR|nr:hypothetical protein DY000_02004693 [Brassica cretica]